MWQSWQYTRVHGTLPEFSGKDWLSYQERLGFYFEANDIDTSAATKQRAILLSVIGTDTYTLLRSLAAPKSPSELSYTQLCKLLADHFQPKPNTILQRYTFYSAFRKKGQSINEYVAHLKDLARTCEFGTTPPDVTLTQQIILEENLRDRLVCGIADTAIQRRLLGETELTFEKALSIALAMESAASNTAQLHTSYGAPPTHSDVNKLSSASGKHFHLKQPQKPPKHDNSHRVNKPCFRCGKAHSPNDCRYKNTTCHFCKKVGHIDSYCFAKKRARAKPTNYVSTEGEDTIGNLTTSDHECPPEDYNMYTITGSRPEPMTYSIKVDGKPLLMEVDTGATLSIISHDTMIKHWGDHPPVLRTSKDRLRTYTGEIIQIQGIADVTVQDKNGKSRILPLAVISGTGLSLLGRNWLNEVPIDWPAVHFCKTNEPNSALTDVLDKHPVLFEDSQQVADTGMAKIYVADTPAPRYWKARNLAYMMRDLVSNELDRLLAEDIIEPVQYSEWAAPIVPVMKADRTVRICGDYKLTVNQVAKLDRYPIPRIEDLYAQLGNGTYYTKLDMRHAYEQIALHPDCRKYVTINTHRGLFTYKRLPYGVSSAPGIFQRVMDNLVKGIPNTMVYLDDILITGSTEEEHLTALDQVLSRLEQAGFRLKSRNVLSWHQRYNT